MLQSKWRDASLAALERSGLRDPLVNLMWRSASYWVRLSTLHVVSSLLAHQSDKTASGKALELKQQHLVADELSGVKLAYKMLSLLNFPFMSTEMASSLESALLSMIKEGDTGPLLDHEEIIKILRKASYIGRRLLVGTLRSSIGPQNSFLTVCIG